MLWICRDHQTISPKQLQELITEKDVYIIDVRNPSEIGRDDYIKTKRRINIPLPELGTTF